MTLRVNEDSPALFDAAQAHIDAAFQAVQQFQKHILNMQAEGMEGEWMNGLLDYTNSVVKIHGDNHERVSKALTDGKGFVNQVLLMSKQMGQGYQSGS
jgi:hypothetical protein